MPRPLIRDRRVSIASRYRPGGRRMLLGGDFYDVVESVDGSLHAIIGDVAGHGPDQAALGVALRIAWRTMTLAGHSATETLATMDQLLVHERHNPRLFTTGVRSASCRSGGRRRSAWPDIPRRCLRAAGRWAALPQVNGPALGALPDGRWEPVTVALPEGQWSMLLYTGGIIEGRVNAGERQLGVEGLMAILGNPRMMVSGAAPDRLVLRHRRVTAPLTAGPTPSDRLRTRRAAAAVAGADRQNRPVVDRVTVG